MIAQATSVFGNNGVNIENLVNKSRGNYAYTVIDTDNEIPPHALDALTNVEGIIRVRLIK